MRRRLVSIGVTALLPGYGVAGEVIVNASVHLTAAEIRGLFLGEQQVADGIRLVHVDNTIVQDEFLARVLLPTARSTPPAGYASRFARGSPHWQSGAATPR